MGFSGFELEVLQIFWQNGDLTAPEVHERVGRGLAYNTVKTIVDRLEKKGALERVRRFGRTILFRAKVGQEEVTKPEVEGFVRKMFGGDRRALMSHLLEDEALSSEDLAYLEALIERARK